ncbi:MAG: riboflavin biosynthesis protein RibF [Peptococcaceae bacterium]|nr:riboflavin biosynthesis protein RibF [Peptococcaceae bacterium]
MNEWQQFHRARKAAGLGEQAHFSIALGNFDGVHIGHQQLISRMVAETKASRGYCAVLSFDPHPMELIHGHLIPKIMLPAAKAQAIAALGADGYILQNFDSDWVKLPAEDFINHVLVAGLEVNHIYVGFNHSFGFQGKGDAALLQEIAEARGVAVTVMEPVIVDDEVVSSSTIRKRLSLGDVAAAGAMLGYAFTISGEVVKGRQLGHRLGFPTANVLYPRELQPLLPGVYAVEAEVDGNRYPAVANCGYQPTIDASNQTMVLEVHLLGEDMDLYGKQLKTDFIRQIRPEIHFANIEELKKQIALDSETARKIIAEK